MKWDEIDADDLINNLVNACNDDQSKFFPVWIEKQIDAQPTVTLLKEQDSVEYALDVLRRNGWKDDSYSDLLKEQEAEWIYGEDETGVDGWHCSYCGFFEPWFYDFDDDINFIKRYEHCPKCGRRMISYTGKQEGR